MNPVNHTPYIPVNAGEQKWSNGETSFLSFFESDFGKYGWSGIIAGAGVVFFAFIGFDAVSTAAQEAKNPKRDMPVGILASLAICTLLYVLFGHVLTGIANYKEFAVAGKEASVAYTIETYMHEYQWLSLLVIIAILAGFSSVILVLLLGQSRVFYSMSKDGLIPKVFSAIHPKFKTPYKSNLIFMAFVGFFAAFIPGDVVGDMTSIGTLFAFVLVCIGVMVMRKTDPDIKRPFKTPLMPVVPVLGALACLLMMVGLGKHNWERLIVWMLIGFAIYYAYSIKHSLIRKGITVVPDDLSKPEIM
jgi:APA family basic amino acid/polyamine antiporter